MARTFDELIGVHTNQVIKKLMRYLNRQLVPFGITLEQWLVLAKLSEEEDINQRMLAIKTGKDPAALLRILDLLEAKSLVKRKKDKEDRRAFSLCLTPSGWDLKDRVEPFIEEHFQKIVKGIPAEQIDVYVNVLEKMESNLGKT